MKIPKFYLLRKFFHKRSLMHQVIGLIFVLFDVNGLVSIAWAVLVSFHIYELVEGFLLLKKGLHTDNDLIQMGIDYFGFVAGVIVGGLVFLIAGC